MLTVTELQARLQQMIAEEPEGKDARALLLGAAEFRGWFDLQALATVAGHIRYPRPSHAEVLELLHVLKRRGFIHTSGQKYSIGYPTLVSLRPFAGGSYSHSRYYLDMKRYPDLSSIEADWSNICLALVWGLEFRRLLQPPGLVEQFLTNLQVSMGQSIHHERWHTILATMYALGRHFNAPLERALTRKMLGVLAFLRQDHEGAIAAYAKTVPLYANTGLDSSLKQARTFQVMGYFAQQANDLTGARQHYQKAWMIDPDDRVMEILKSLAHMQNDLHGRLLYLRDAYHLARLRRNPPVQVTICCEIADSVERQGHRKLAWQFYKHALDVSRRAGHRRGEFDVSMRLGTLASSLKAYRTACEMFGWAVRIGEIENAPASEHTEDALWAWGLSEFSFDYKSNGIALCSLAILTAENRISRLPKVMQWEKSASMREQLEILSGGSNLW